MPLSQEDKLLLLESHGKSTEDYEILDSASGGYSIRRKKKEQPPVAAVESPANLATSQDNKVSEVTPAGVFGRNVLKSAAPTLGAIAGGSLLAAPFTGGTSLLVPLLVGLGGAALGGGITSEIQDAVLPDSAKKFLAEGSEENPGAAAAGQLAASLIALKPDLKSVASVARGVGNVAKGRAVDPRQISNALNVGVGAGVEAGQEGYRILTDDKPLDTQDLIRAGLATATGAVINNPNRIGRRIGLAPNVYENSITHADPRNAQPLSSEETALKLSRESRVPSEAEAIRKAAYSDEAKMAELQERAISTGRDSEGKAVEGILQPSPVVEANQKLKKDLELKAKIEAAEARSAKEYAQAAKAYNKEREAAQKAKAEAEEAERILAANEQLALRSSLSPNKSIDVSEGMDSVALRLQEGEQLAQERIAREAGKVRRHSTAEPLPIATREDRFPINYDDAPQAPATKALAAYDLSYPAPEVPSVSTIATATAFTPKKFVRANNEKSITKPEIDQEIAKLETAGKVITEPSLKSKNQEQIDLLKAKAVAYRYRPVEDAPTTDASRFKQIWNTIREKQAADKSFAESDEFHNLWKEAEGLKNKNKGMPPVDETQLRSTSGEDADNTPQWFQNFIKRLGIHRNVEMQLTKERLFADDGVTPVDGKAKVLRDGIKKSVASARLNRPDNAPHELFHIFLADLAASKSASGRKLAARAKEIVELSDDFAVWKADKAEDATADWNEFLTEEVGTAFWKRVQEKKIDNEFFKDFLAHIKVRYSKNANVDDAVRLMTNKLRGDASFYDTHPTGRVTVGEAAGKRLDTEDDATRYRKPKDDSDFFTTAIEKELNGSNVRPFGLTKANDNTIPVENLVARIKKTVAKDEYEAYKEQGLEDYFKGKSRVNVDELNHWIAENSPRVEVKKLDARAGDVTDKSKRFADLKHMLDTNGWVYGGATDTFRDSRTNKELNLEELSQHQYDKLQEFRDLYHAILEGRSFDSKANDSATARYEMVNPKPLEEMEGAVDILVRKSPAKNYEGDFILQANGKYKIVKDGIDVIPNKEFDSTDDAWNYAKRNLVKYTGNHFNSSDKNIIGWTRGYMETLPNGKKVFHIFELQSDWAQLVHKFGVAREEGRITDYRPNDPQTDATLPYYESLALKSAIKHALDNGADYIAVSDSKTAMLTEGHDAAAQATPIETVPLDRSKMDSEDVRELEFKLRKKYPADRYEMYTGYYDIQINDKLNKQITQQKGMELHYDNSVPNILRKLTQSEPTEVNFGEHKNAFEGDDNVAGEHTGLAMQRGKRSDLLIENNKGESKTDITARMFPLDKISERINSGDKFNTFSSRYRKPTEVYPENPAEGNPFDNAKRSPFNIIKSMTPAFDKVKAISPEVGEALHNFSAREDNYKGRFVNTTLDNLTSLEVNQETLNKTVEKMRKMYRENLNDPEFTAEESAVKDVLQSMFSEVRKEQNTLGLQIAGRDGKFNEWYVPDMMNNETLRLFSTAPDSTPARRAKNLWAQHLMKSDSDINAKEAKELIDNYINSIGNKNFKPSLKFGALEKVQGLGLPLELRELDAMSMVSKYGRRASKRLAMFSEIESKDSIAAALNVKNPNTGKVPEVDGVTNLTGAEDVSQALKFVYGTLDSGAGEIHRGVVRIVNNALLGFGTGVRDLASIPVNTIPYLNSLSDYKVFVTALRDIGKARKESLFSNARQKNLDKLQWSHLSNPEEAGSVLNSIADALRVYQGREALEQGSRIYTFAIGKELAKTNYIKHLAGDAKATEWLHKFGRLTNISEDVDMDKAFQQIAKNFTDRVQGTYDGRGLPAGILEGPMAPYLTLSKWGIEKFNIINKDVLEPLTKGNYLPFLTYTTGALLTGAAIRELNELLSNKKDSTASVKESLSADSSEHFAAAVVNLMQQGSYFGIASDIARMASDATINKELPRGLSFPAMDFVSNTLSQNIIDARIALDNGGAASQVLPALVGKILSDSVQSWRLLMNNTVASERLKRSDKFRDVRVFKKLRGNEVPPIGSVHSNPFDDMDVKAFKRSSDPEEIPVLADKILEELSELAKTNPEKAMKKLKNLKRNNSQTFPSPETDIRTAAEFYEFLVKTQGEEEADARYKDFLHQREVNKAKTRIFK